jgi:LysM repeat protein
MSALTFNTGFNSTTSKSIVNQALQANPSGGLTRRGRLARTLFVLSLSVVLVAGFASRSGANQLVSDAAPTFTTVVVAPGETLWSVAAAYATGDVQAMVSQIREANNLKGLDLQAGQKLRVPLK